MINTAQPTIRGCACIEQFAEGVVSAACPMHSSHLLYAGLCQAAGCTSGNLFHLIPDFRVGLGTQLSVQISQIHAFLVAFSSDKLTICNIFAKLHLP